MAVVECGDGRGNHRGARTFERGESHTSRARLQICLQLMLCGADAPRIAVSVTQQDLARLGGARALAVALDEDRAGLALERGDLLASRRTAC